MPEQKKLKVILLRHTLSPEETVALAAKLCYSKSTISDLNEKISSKDQSDFIAKLMDMGHESVLEHASFTFAVEGISRACSHQLVRHRLASYSQQSQRYVRQKVDSMGFFPFEMPKSIRLCTTLIDGVSKDPGQINYECNQLMYLIGRMYKQMVEAGIPEEDARYILPNACMTNIVVTMNARELRHFFSLRLCTRAQWEIRQLAEKTPGRLPARGK